MGEPEAVAAEVAPPAEAEEKPTPIDADADAPAEPEPVEAGEPEPPPIPAGVASLFLTGERFVLPFPQPLALHRRPAHTSPNPDADAFRPSPTQIKPERSRGWRTWARSCP